MLFTGCAGRPPATGAPAIADSPAAPAPAFRPVLLHVLEAPEPVRSGEFGRSLDVRVADDGGSALLAIGASQGVFGTMGRGGCEDAGFVETIRLSLSDEPHVEAKWCGLTGYGARSGWVVRFGDDIDDDGIDEIYVTELQDTQFRDGQLTGCVRALSGATGKVIWTTDGRHIGEHFGNSLAIVRDVDGDDIRDVAVGVPGGTGWWAGRGRVEVLSGSSGARLWELSGPGEWSNFGECVCAAKDGWVAASAPEDGWWPTHPGTVVLADPTTRGAWRIAQPAWAGNGFGRSLARTGGTGSPSGARLYIGDNIAGAIGVLDLSDRHADVQPFVCSPFPARDASVHWDPDEFGKTLAVVGDCDGDGIADLAVGAPHADVAGDDSGRVYLFSGVDSSLLGDVQGTREGEEFGSSLVAFRLGDAVLLAVGAPGPWWVSGPSGRVYVWRLR